MGNSHKRKQLFGEAQCLIQLEQTTVIAGRNIQGVVHLDIKRQHPASFVELLVTAVESRYWVETETRERGEGNDRTTETIELERSKQINHLELRKPIHFFPDRCAHVGQFSIPFDFEIPVHSPPSYIFRGNKKSEFEMKYTLIARLSDPEKKVKDIEGERVLLVRN